MPPATSPDAFVIAYRESPSLKQALLLTLVIGVYIFAFLGLRPLSVPSEARYAELPREMVASGDWVTPTLNGVKYFEKPPMIYWLNSTALMAFGENEFAVRFWPALMGLAGCIVTYLAGSALYGRRTAVLAALILAAGPIYFSISRIALTDMAVSTFMVTCLFCFITAIDWREGRARRLVFYAGYVSAACALLTKGLIGIVVPGAVIFLWLAATGRWALLKTIYLPTGLVLLLAIAVPWHVLAGQRTPEFWWFYFVHEHFLRYVTPVSQREEAWWFFPAIILINFVAWLPCMFRSHWDAIKAVKRARWQEQKTLFMLAAIAFPFLFFSASESKLVPYIVPVFPFMSLLMADRIMRWIDDGIFCPKLAYSAFGLCVLIAAAAIFMLLFPKFGKYDKSEIATLAHLLPVLCSCYVLLAGGVYYAIRKHKAELTAALILIASAGLGLFGDVGAAQAQFKSVKPMAQYLKPRQGTVMTYFNYNQDLPFYLDRTVTVVEWQGELAFGMTLEKTPQMIRLDEFKRRWFSDEPVYIVVRTPQMREFDLDTMGEFYVVMTTSRHALLSNHKDMP